MDFYLYLDNTTSLCIFSCFSSDFRELSSSIVAGLMVLVIGPVLSGETCLETKIGLLLTVAARNPGKRTLVMIIRGLLAILLMMIK